MKTLKKNESKAQKISQNVAKLRGSFSSRNVFLSAMLCLLASVNVQASNHLVSVQSSHTVEQTADRFEQLIKKKGLTLFNRIDHAKNAQGVGMTLRPSQVVIFGNPKMGTKLMQCQQSIAIDLPLKVHVWQDVNQKTWLSYYDPAYIQFNHQVKGCDAVFKNVSKALGALTMKAAN